MAALSQATYWLVAMDCHKDGPHKEGMKEEILNRMKMSTKSLNDVDPVLLHVPDAEDESSEHGLKFGTFDNLIRLTDDLAKMDSQVEGILRRIERQYLEIKKDNDEFKVYSQRETLSFDAYLHRWKWDGAKYPQNRSIMENAANLMTVMTRLDEETRNKASQYNDVKTLRSNLTPKDSGNFMTLDLVDILTPNKVTAGNSETPGDFYYTEHVTTLVVVVPRGGEADFLKSYETLCEDVVPESAKKIDKVHVDKEGNALWRVCVFKTAAESFRKASREKRYVVRDFEYSEKGYHETQEKRESYEREMERQLNLLIKLCAAAWSDVMIAWTHLKAMRVYVESTLRFGVGSVFATILLAPKASSVTAVRAALKRVTQCSDIDQKLEAAAEAEGEEYLPYVSFTFTPFLNTSK